MQWPNKEKLDTHFLVWIWPLSLPVGLIMLAVLGIIYAWLWVGNFLIENTLNNPKLQ